MLTSFEVIAASGITKKFALEDYSNGYLVQNIDGLDPVKATLVSSVMAGLDGARYGSGRREVRNIKITLGLEPDYAVEDVSALRTRLYSLFAPKSTITLRFSKQVGVLTKTYDIVGVVETLESPLFTRFPTADISVLCYDPDFYETEEVTFNATSAVGLEYVELDYEGTTDTGFVFTLTPVQNTTAFNLQLINPSGKITSMGYTDAVNVGSSVTFDTRTGFKSATKNTAGVVTNVQRYMDYTSKWGRLYPGKNQLRLFVNPSSATASYAIRYLVKHGGL